MNTKKLLKAANSKGQLVKAVVLYQRALSHYANESNWAVKGDDIVWLGDDDPAYAAQVSLGKRKPDPTYAQRNANNLSGNRTESEPTTNVKP